ncbi:HEPN domain-containing protein [Pararhizobium qamdonense]|uniref:HEPN domain-containing protein n=1 Tax=Pararhizobium qamdonense TaxID=3031126 RepID=UPI0023E21383|nr:HEPN domain-containing protein [Pararhizobium qamdonense]
MAQQIEELYGQLGEVTKILVEHCEVTLQVTITDLQRKSLLMACASYFEHKLSTDVEVFCARRTGKMHPVVFLVKAKAISRQYHSWFDWDKRNANTFFGLFGPEFKSWMIEKVKQDADLERDIQDFLTLGNSRNLLVHKDFQNYALNDSFDEIYARYRNANNFVEKIGEYLEEFSAIPKDEQLEIGA